MRTRIFIPPLKGATGGTAVLHQVAECLYANEYDVALVPYDERAPGVAESAVPVLPWKSLQLTPNDLWLVPEGWVNALMPGLQAGARNVLYVQNWAYLHGALPQGVQWSQLNVNFLSVSDPVAWYTEQTTGKSGPVLRPGIDRKLFYAPESKPAIGADSPVRIAWMPRKNSALAKQIRQTFEARLAACGLGLTIQVEWVEISGKSLPEVAALLRHSHIFLATGFPEGCPLPPLEALSSGCLLVGFSGFGGWDYMRQADINGFAPWWPLRDVTWSGNSFVVADADVPAAAFALERAVALLAREAGITVPADAGQCGAGVCGTGEPDLARIREQARITVEQYSAEKQREAILRLWTQAEKGNVF